MEQIDRYPSPEQLLKAGVTMGDAAKRCVEDPDVYYSTLRAFAKNDTLLPLSRAMADGRTDDAAEEAHRLKHLTADLGLCGLAQLAEELMDELKDCDADDSDEYFVRLSDAYDAAAAELRSLL